MNRRYVASTFVVAVAAALVLALVLTGCQSQSATSEDVGSSAVPESPPAAEISQSSSNEPASVPSEEPASEASAPAPDPTSASEPTLDLGDPSDRALLNKALSWMAQAFPRDTVIGDAGSDAHAQVQLATQYLGVLNPDYWERGSWPEVEGASTGADGAPNVRVKDSYIQIAAKRFFDSEVDFSALADDPMFAYDNGYVYFGVTAPAGQMAWYAAATDVEELDEGRYLVSFGAVANGMPYKQRDEEFFAQEYGAMMGSLDQAHPDYSTKAVVRVDVADGEKSIAFEAWGTDQVAASPQDGHGDLTVETQYYRIDIPADWLSDYEISYDIDESMSNGQAGEGVQGTGCTTNVHIGSATISTACFTDDWGLQGAFISVGAGPIPALPGWHILVYAPHPSYPGNPATDPDVSGELERFASFVTPAGSEDVPAVSEESAPDFQAQLDAINADKAADARMGGTTAQMIEVGNEYYERYNALMADIVAYLEGRPGVDQDALAASQADWEAAVAARVQATADEYAGGSLTGPAVLGVQMEMQEQRIRDLIAMV